MSGSKNISLAAKLSGLALCTFMTACGQSSPETAAVEQSTALNVKLVNMAAKAAKVQPTQEECNSMISYLLIPSIQKDDTPEMNKARLIIGTRCPN